VAGATNAPIESVGIVGGGFMGSGIAESVARAGLPVRVQEPERAPLDRARKAVDASLARAVKGGKLEVDEAAEATERIEWTTELSELADRDLVIEAVVEDPTIKGEVFQALDALLAPEALIASNTSSIPIAQLASWTDRPDRVLGMHFFSPAQVMKLVELVVGIDTGEESLQRAAAFAERIGKTAIRTKDRSGFIVNMLLVPYLMAGVRMYEDGFATAEDIDLGMKLGCGHPMGPLELSDFIGLDVLYAVCDSLYEEFKRPEYAPPPLLKRMVVSGHHGRKSGRGFHTYTN
jgi:3-hydroxybutyryl-CoA dehydrogenase